MIQTIVFDFGNVIGYFDHGRATRRLAARTKDSVEAIHSFLFGGGLEDAYEAGRISSAEYLQLIRDRFGVSGPDHELGEIYGDIFTPNQDVCNLLPNLKPRYRLLLGSNTTELHARRFLRQFADTLRHFDALVLSYLIGARKPGAAFFDHCRRLAGCAAADCLFIDDVPANVAGAEARGWKGIVYVGIEDLRLRMAALGVTLDDEHAARSPPAWRQAL